MDLPTLLTAAGLAGGIFGAVLLCLVKIEHRITRLETTINERLPRG